MPAPATALANRQPPRPRRLVIWACIDARRRGSFEDYLLAMAAQAQHQAWQVDLVIGDATSATIRRSFASAGLDVHYRPIAELLNGRHMTPLLSEIAPDILHLHFASPCSPLIKLAQRHRPMRLVVTDHASTIAAPRSHWLRPFKQHRRRRYGRWVDLHIGVSDYISQRLRRNRSGRRIETLHNGVDLKRFCPLDDQPQRQHRRQQVFNASEDDILLGFVGQLNQHKGFDLLLQMMRCLPDPRYRLIVAGEGPLRQHPLADNPAIQFLGIRDDLPELMPLWDLLLVPSRWGEAFGYVVTEAAGSGLCTIASDRGALSELIADGLSGRLLEPTEPQTWAKTVRDLALNPQQRQSLAAAAREQAQRRFDLDAMVKRSFELYTALRAAAS